MESGYVKINVASVKDGRASIYFKYNESAVSILKAAVPGSARRYCSENRTWDVDIRSFPDLIKCYKQCNERGMFFECSSLVTAYMKYCEKNGIENEFAGSGDPVPLQEELFPLQSMPQKAYEMMDVIPEGYTGTMDPDLPVPVLPAGSGFKPYPHQISGAAVLLKNRKYILADTMGLGKTFTAILAAYNTAGRKLIVTPASLKLNWRNEIIRFGIHESDICVISSKTVKDDLKNGAEWVIVNYDSLRCVHREIPVSYWAENFATAVFDEAHYCKAINAKGGPGSIRSKFSAAISEKVPNVYLLTGTPITNKTKDIFMLLKMVGSPLAKNWFSFAHRYCGARRNSFGWQFDGASNREELNRKLRDCMLRRRIENILDMPQKIRSYIPVEADLKEYDRILNRYLSVVESSDNLAVLGAMKHAAALGKTEKTCALISDLLENGKSVVVYTCYLDPAEKIFSHFREDCVKITGDVSAEARQAAVEKFQRGDKKVIVCTVSAGGVGLTLTQSDVVVFNDFDYSAANMRQAEDWIWRIGQRNACSIFYVYADKCLLDETLCDMLNKKLSNMGKIIDGKEDALVTGEDDDNRAILLKKLLAMKSSAEKKRKSRKKIRTQEPSVLQPFLIPELC